MQTILIILKMDVCVESVSTTEQEPLNIETQFTSLAQDLISIKTYINEMQMKFRLLEKNVLKSNKPPKPEKKTQQVSGFDLPVLISDELCAFMNKPNGSILSRSNVTDYVINYINKNKLQDMIKRKKINPNESLYNLLQLKSNEEEITFFNLQKYLNVHFV